MGNVPMAANSLAGIVTNRELLLTNVVGRSAPFQRTFDNVENPDPSIEVVTVECPTPKLSRPPALITGTGSDASPVPLRAALPGLPVPLLVITRDPVRFPSIVGENVTLIVQLPFTASVA